MIYKCACFLSDKLWSLGTGLTMFLPAHHSMIMWFYSSLVSCILETNINTPTELAYDRSTKRIPGHTMNVNRKWGISYSEQAVCGIGWRKQTASQIVAMNVTCWFSRHIKMDLNLFTPRRACSTLKINREQAFLRVNIL